jgi:hypothetical protein
MLQRFRETLTLALIGLLPFHALLVTVLTRVIAGPGHAPLTVLALWKEVLLGIILFLAIVEAVFSFRRVVSGQWSVVRWWKIDLLDGSIIAFTVIALLVSWTARAPLGSLALGIRYDLLPLAAFVVLRRVPWSEAFMRRALSVLLWVGCAIAAYALLTLVLPDAFFRALGYSDLHSLYVPGGPIAAFQHLGGLGIPRLQGPMSGPNQLGLWLLLPLTIALLRWAYSERFDALRLVPLLLIGLAIDGSFSRSAWIASGVILIIVLAGARHGSLVRKVGAGFIVLAVAGALVLLVLKPDVVLRAASSRDHWLKPVQAMRVIAAHPIGLGLGAAGPASNRVSDACVHLEAGADASWAQAHPQLCVFVGGRKVQPAERACRCPFLPENWYLQIGVETGVIGLILYLGVIALVLFRLRRASMTVFLWFVGVSVAGMFLHAWEDPALAFTAWAMAGVVSPLWPESRVVKT